MKRYGLYGPVSRDFLTYGGRVLWHSDAAELAYLVPKGAVVREIPPSIPPELTLPISQHPRMAAVTWPLDKRNFR